MANYNYETSASIYLILPGLQESVQSTLIIEKHIERSESIINGMIARRYEVPFTSTAVPPMIRVYAQDIAAYYTMRSMFTRDAQNTNEWVKEHYDKAIEELKKIQLGELDLINTAGSFMDEKSVADKIWSSKESYIPAFDVDKDTSWEVDPDYLDKVEGDRG